MRRKGATAGDLFLVDLDLCQGPLAKAAGFEGVVVAIADDGPITPASTQADCDKIRAEADAAGIRLVALASGMGGRYPVTSPDPEMRRKGMTVITERGTLMFNTLRKPRVAVCTEDGAEPPVELPAGSAYQDEIDYFARCLRNGEDPNARVPLGDSRATVETVLEENRQIFAKNGVA